MNTFKLTLISFLFFCSGLLQAQRESVENLHTAFISQKLNLTDDEAKKFWPVYDQYKSDMDALKKQRKDNRQMVVKAGGIDNMKDEDVQKLISNETDIESRELELRKEYIAKFEQAIPARKLAKFYMAEDEFKIYLLKQLGNRKGMNRRENDSQFVPE